jgi:predicted O-methyltransferase YrrM
VGVASTGPAGGAALRLLATVIGARHVVEIGTGSGVSDGVLTSVDVEPEYQRLAKQAFADAGFAPSRARLIGGRALDVLARLTDGAYDLVFVDGERTEYADYLEAARRLLRPGGVIVFDGALAGDAIGDPGARDPSTNAVRDLGRALRDDAEFVPALLPVADGFLVAVKVAQPDAGGS